MVLQYEGKRSLLIVFVRRRAGIVFFVRLDTTYDSLGRIQGVLLAEIDIVAVVVQYTRPHSPGLCPGRPCSVYFQTASDVSN